MSSEIPQINPHSRDICRSVIFCWKLWWAVKNYGRIAIKLGSADNRVQWRRSRYEDGSRLTESRHVERRRWFGEKLSDWWEWGSRWPFFFRSRYEDGSRPIKSRHVERRRWFGEKLSDTFFMHVSWNILISLSSREHVTRGRWVLERMEFFLMDAFNTLRRWIRIVLD